MATLKLNFSDPVPYTERNKLIHGLQALGLHYDHVYQNGQYALNRFYGRLPTINGESDVDILFDDTLKSELKQYKISDIEIFILSERKSDYENKLRI